MTSPFRSPSAAVFGESRPYASRIIVPHLEAIAEHLAGSIEARGETENRDDAIDLGGEEAPFDPLVSQLVEPVPMGSGPASTLRWLWSSPNESGESLATLAHARVKDLLDEVVERVNLSVDEWERIGCYSLLGQETARKRVSCRTTVPMTALKMAQPGRRRSKPCIRRARCA